MREGMKVCEDEEAHETFQDQQLARPTGSRGGTELCSVGKHRGAL